MAKKQPKRRRRKVSQPEALKVTLPIPLPLAGRIQDFAYHHSMDLRNALLYLLATRMQEIDGKSHDPQTKGAAITPLQIFSGSHVEGRSDQRTG